MSFDAWVVGFGLSRVLIELKAIPSPEAYGIWLAVILVDLYLLYNYFTRQQQLAGSSLAVEISGDGPGIGWQNTRAPSRDDRRP